MKKIMKKKSTTPKKQKTQKDASAKIEKTKDLVNVKKNKQKKSEPQSSLARFWSEK